MTPDGINGVIDEIQEDPKVKALVVRVNSPGGDAVAAELIRARLVEYKKKTGNPVIISMGDTAASGGYWIATAGDRIVADPLSITGSIGVFAMSVHAEGLREELKVDAAATARRRLRTSAILLRRPAMWNADSSREA